MGLQAVPGFIGQSGFQHPVELMRNLTEAMYDKTGAFRLGQWVATPLVGQLGLGVTGGQMVIVGNESNQQGAYFIWSDGVDNLLFPSPSGSQRWDSLIMRVMDPQYGTISGSPRVTWEVVTGVAGAGAPRPDSDFNSGGPLYVPGAWVRVYDVRIDPADVVVNPVNVIWRLGYTRQSGGTQPVLSTARPGSPALGDTIYEYDTTLTWRWTGSAWTLASPYVRKILVGVATPTVTFSGIPANLSYLKVGITSRLTANSFRARSMLVRVNNDSTAGNYRSQSMQISGNAASFTATGGTETSLNLGLTTTAISNPGIWGTGEIRVTGWSNPHTKGVGIAWESVNPNDLGSGSSLKWSNHGAGAYVGNGPFNRLDFIPEEGNWEVGSEFTLIGEA